MKLSTTSRVFIRTFNNPSLNNWNDYHEFSFVHDVGRKPDQIFVSAIDTTQVGPIVPMVSDWWRSVAYGWFPLASSTNNQLDIRQYSVGGTTGISITCKYNLTWL